MHLKTKVRCISGDVTIARIRAANVSLSRNQLKHIHNCANWLVSSKSNPDHNEVEINIYIFCSLVITRVKVAFNEILTSLMRPKKAPGINEGTEDTNFFISIAEKRVLS